MKYAKITALGALLLVVGFGALNWQYFREQLAYYLNRPDTAVVNDTPAIDETGEPNRLSIPSLGIFAPVNYATEVNEDHFQEQLRHGVVHYPGTAMPGQEGNAYLFGHSSDLPTAPGDYKTVFALLPRMELGQVIEITDQDGNLYRYRATEKFPAENTDTHLLQQDYSRKQLTLQTSYPIGTALRRYIVIAQLIE